jgi:acetate kinase
MILAINAGSTSLKYKLFDEKLRPLVSNEFVDVQINQPIFKQLTNKILNTRYQILNTKLKIVHRVVHGGPKYRNLVKLTAIVIKEIKKFESLAPLHNPYNLAGIELAQKYFPDIDQYAVFDTGFYQTLPDKAKIYPLPLKFYQKYKIQKYGFHGISHQYALWQAKHHLKIGKPNVISLHLGGGCSITAIKAGKAIDTSMGFTPMQGLMMWSRAGDIDLGIVLNSNLKSQISKPHLQSQNWRQILNYKSGLKGISGCRNYLDLLERYKQGDKRAQLAIKMFVYRIQKYIGAYYAVLDGKIDAIVFTGKIGAGDAITRKLVMKNLSFLKGVKVIAIEPDEEKMMATLIFNWLNQIPIPNNYGL